MRAGNKLKMINFLKRNKYLIIILLFFGVIYSLFSLLNHYNFRTNAYDLGIFNQEIYHYANFSFKENTVREVPLLLGDHFEVMLLLFAPFYWIFKSYTLLILQIIFILFGGLGVYLFIKKTSKSKKIALFSILIFFLHFGIFDAVSFDYHNDVLALMLIPWLLFFIKLKKFKYYWLFLAFFLLFKENMAIISLFLGIYLLFFRDKKLKKIGFFTVLISIFYFFLVVFLIIPSLNPEGEYYYWSSYVSGERGGFLKILIQEPWIVFTRFIDHEIKLKMLRLIIISGGFFVFFDRRLFFLLIPLITMKFYSSNQAYWGHMFHYSVGFAPLTAIAIGLFSKRMKKERYENILMLLFIVLNIFILTQIHFYDLKKIDRFFKEDHYTTSFTRETVVEAINKIPKNASVSAQNSLVPHLADRDKIYLYPKKTDTDYLIFNLADQNIWPVENISSIKDLINKKTANGDYKLIYHEDEVFILKKID